MGTGREFSRQFYTRSLDSLHAGFADRNFALKDLRDFREKVEQTLGEEEEITGRVSSEWSGRGMGSIMKQVNRGGVK